MIAAIASSTVWSAAALLVRIAPTFRDAIVALIRALQDDDEEKAREAYEAARRAAFIARQR